MKKLKYTKKSLLSRAVLFATSLVLLGLVSGQNVAYATFGPNPPEPHKCEGQSDLDCVRNNPITEKLLEIANFLAIGVGVVIVIMVIVGGIKYTSAGGDPNKVADAKKTISNALIALLAYILLYAFIQWLVPGGVF